jgi:hypothetical protein
VNPALIVPGNPRVEKVPASAAEYLVRSGAMAAGRPLMPLDFLADGRVIAAQTVVDDAYGIVAPCSAPLAGQKSN